MKKVLYIVVGIAVVGLIAFILTNNKKKNENETAQISKTNSTVAVRIDTVKTEVPNLDYVANGNFAPSQELEFPAENSGRVVKVLVDEGSPVRIGQTLAIIKGDQLSIEVANTKAAYQNAVTNNQRYENAFKTGGVTKQQLDQAKLDLVNAKARLDQANINYGDATIKSSINGIVNKRNIEPGSVVAPGTVLFELVNVSTLKLKVNVDEQHVAGLKLGNSITVKASVYPDKEFKGKVTFIAPKADGSLNFPVEIEVANNPDSEIKAGMYGTATFGSGAAQKTPIKTIPRIAFVGGVASNQVFVVKDSVVTLKKIVAGRILGEQVEILDGLATGDIVVTSGQINLTNGSKVTPIK
ncbi:efflux RND transporter periplasmic adaptor subunit [Flavobacterium sp. DG1-102-2]|uniref:efflux RND transporter periplasmic adaptor subunit n=1 Tax=Flavobacterium sp. DG1-102-2 TaxID=3081663 RepID=UPI00294991CC|nr:efflux RND transporter periplasmic adaptor subunit [Flavobacterium sp. DG1-102-2]MDV6167463.1 efflux RND transporter periplasmic adaptor subunit [Flavobacterium sp. DG1-102-2]